MNKVLFLGDLHLGIRNGNNVFLNMMKKYFNEELFPYILKNNIKYVIQLGDILDKRKSIDFIISNYLTNTFFKFFEDNEIHFYSTVGNHDLYYRQSVELDGPSQFSNSKYIHIIKTVTAINIYNKQFILCPWICEENKEQIIDDLQKIENTESSFLCGHFELSGFPIQRGFISDKGTLSKDLLSKYFKVISGHYHSPSSKDNISYIGTPYQLTWSDYGDRKKVIVYDFDESEFEEIYTKIELYHKIFYSDDIKITYKDYDGCYVKVVLNSEYNEKKLNLFLSEFENSADLLSLQVINQLDDISTIEDISISDIDNPIDIMINVINDRITDENIRTLTKNISYEIYKEAQSAIS